MTMMVIPVSQHKLIKIRRVNRRKLTILALYCSMASCLNNIIEQYLLMNITTDKVSNSSMDLPPTQTIHFVPAVICRRVGLTNVFVWQYCQRILSSKGSSTNSWLYTSEVLKYYVFPNNTQNHDDTQLNQPVYFKNASLGPWVFCWLDPITEFHCNSVYYFQDEDPSDVTTSVQQSVRRSFIFMMFGMVLDILGLVLSFVCYCLPNPYASLFFATVVHINAGIANFLCIIVFMSAVSKEVGNKIHPASEMDDPLFHFEYGFSFILLKCSFLLTELAALFSIVVYMAKRDERTFNRYKIRSMLSVKREIDEDNTEEIIHETYHHHTRFSQLKRPGSISSQAPSLESIVRTKSPTPTVLPPLIESAQDSVQSEIFMLV